jgi:hypothetical protein
VVTEQDEGGTVVRLITSSILVLFILSGCVDVRGFAGSWSGGIVSEDAVRQGFSAETNVDPLVLSNVDIHGLDAMLSLSDGKFKETRLERVVKFSNDALASLSFDGAPLRSYLLFSPFASDPNGWPASLVISFFADDHVEMRVLRGNDFFGVFYLHRKE